MTHACVRLCFCVLCICEISLHVSASAAELMSVSCTSLLSVMRANLTMAQGIMPLIRRNAHATVTGEDTACEQAHIKEQWMSTTLHTTHPLIVWYKLECGLVAG